MAAEAINKHFQQHTQCKTPDEIAAVTGDFVKCKPFHSKKRNIYVHEFLNVKQNPGNCESFQNELHRHLYNHEIDHNRKFNKSDRIKSKSFQNSYITDSRSSKTPVHSCSNPKAQEVLRNRNTIAKLEESYWANWRPSRSETVKPRKIPKAHYMVIRKRPPTPEPTDSYLSDDEEEDTPKSTTEAENQAEVKIIPETQTENSNKVDVKEVQTKKSEEIQVVPADLSQTEESSSTAKEVENEEDKLIKREEGDEVSSLKHTDSLILNAKRRSEDKPRYQQPRCIKLFRKPTVSGSLANITRGGSYPLKPALKKEKSIIRGNIRLGKPGSPIMIQTNKGKRTIL